MWNFKKSVNLSIAVCIVLTIVLGIMVFTGSKIFELYMVLYRGFQMNGEAIKILKAVFIWDFYPSAIFAAAILYSLFKLLFNIKSGEVFISSNVKYLKLVSWFCFVIAIINFIGGFFYLPFIFVAAAGGFVGVMLRVLKNVMQSAVELKEENELTI